MIRALFSPFVLVVAGVAMAGAAIASAATHTVPPPYTIVWGGDTFLGDRALPQIEQYGYGWPLAKLPDLASADLAVVNLEAPLTDIYRVPANAYYDVGSPTARYDVFTSRGQVRRYVHRGSPAAAPALAAAGIDVGTLSNNHALDQGADGLADTALALQAVGMRTLGAGQTAEEAARPLLIDTPFGRVGIFSFGEEGGTSPAATPTSAGIHILSTENLDAATATAKAEGVRWLVAAVHWGNNYADILPTQERWASRFAASGFDLVVGTGSHTTQGVRVIGRTPVLFSLGNMSFNSEGRYTELQPGFGLLATTVLSGRGFRELRLTCIQTDNLLVEHQARPCTDADADRLLRQLAPGITMQGAVGILTW